MIHVKHPFNKIFKFIESVKRSQIYYDANTNLKVCIHLGYSIKRNPKHNILSFHPFYEIIEEYTFFRKLKLFRDWCSKLENANVRIYNKYVYVYKDVEYEVRNYFDGESTKPKIERRCIRNCKQYSKDFSYNTLQNESSLLEARTSVLYFKEESLNKLPHHKDYSFHSVERITEFSIDGVDIIFCNQPKKIKISFSDLEKSTDTIETILKVLWFENPETKVKKPIIEIN